jgi:hypothetical protein
VVLRLRELCHRPNQENVVNVIIKKLRALRPHPLLLVSSWVCYNSEPANVFQRAWKLIKFLSSLNHVWSNFIARDDNLRRNRWSFCKGGGIGQTALLYLSGVHLAERTTSSLACTGAACISLQIIALVRCAALIALRVKEFESVPSRPQIERGGQFGVVRRKRMSHIFQVCRCTKSAERVATAAFICLRRLPRMQYINVDIGGGVSPTELQPRAHN